MSLLDELIPQEPTKAQVCPNVFPKIPPGEKRLAVVGEAPGNDEMVALEPFVGTSGRLLRAILSSCGIACDQVFFGNICQHNPPGNDIDAFAFDGPEIMAGLERLRSDLEKFRPNCVLILGKTGFRAFRSDLCFQSRKGFVIPLADWRGSIFSTTFGGGIYKCVSTYHPSFILRSYGDLPYFKFDVARAVRHSTSSCWEPLLRSGILRPSLSETLGYIESVRLHRLRCTFDIEGYADDVGVTMLSLCTTPTDGIVIPFWISGKNYWTEDEEVEVWQALAGLFYDDKVPKVAHNAFYELFVLAWRHRCAVNNLADDTMMKVWEIFPELERSLAVSCSIYTEQPYYKSGRVSDDVDVKLRYNLTDSQVTDEVNSSTESKLVTTPKSHEHYRFNINLIPAYNYIMLRGCRLDERKTVELRASVEQDISDLNSNLESELGREFNVKSVVDKRWLLYDHLHYKPLKKYGLSTAEDVLLHYWTQESNPLVRLVIRCVRKRTRLSDINKLTPNADGRIRSSYDVVGTNTGRLSSRSSIALGLYDGKWESTGTNLQNVTKELRSCFIPDSPEFDFWQFDLAGADAWTVAADLAAIGHPAMLDDLLYGIKPALVLYYMLQEHAAGRPVSSVNRLDRTPLKNELRNVKLHIDSLEGKTDSQGRPLDWQYLCCKRVQHGCITEGHQVLTKEGWLDISDLREGEEIMTWDKSGKASWDVPSRLISNSFTGEMVNLEGESYSIDMTSDHRVVYTDGRIYKDTNAAGLSAYNSARLPKSAEVFDGYSPDEWLIRLLAAFQADGCQREDGDISFHLKKERKIGRLEQLLVSAKIDYKKYPCADETIQIQFKSRPLSVYGKQTDWRLLKLSSEALRWYLEESTQWDGCIQESYCHKRVELFSAQKLRIEVMHTAAHLCGMSGSMYIESRTSPFGTLMSSCSLNNRTNARLSSIKQEKRNVTNLQVYCVSVKSSYFFVRRNGHIAITGNSNYGARGEKIAEVIFGDSDGSIVLTAREADFMQSLYKLRYNTDARNQRIKRVLSDTGQLIAACGIRRQFFGIRNRREIDDATVREASAFEPQANTTWATNKALERLWYARENRTSRGGLFVEPLLQIHDAVAGQYKSSNRKWAAENLQRWFDNPIVICGTKLVIPADGKFGENWKDCKNAITA